ncbi:MAG: MFS transporter, partial [Acidobacteriota bacterium]
PLFWVIGACAVLIFYPIFTISQQFNLYLQNNIGVSRELAGSAQSVLFATSVLGKFLFGWLCDRFPTRIVMSACCGLMLLSTVMLLGFLNASTIFVFLVPFGLGYGGSFVLIQLLTVESFGLKDIGKILGAITLIETLGGFVGSVVTGRLAAANNGDYTAAFYVVTAVAAVAFTMTFAVNILVKRRNVAA